MLDHRCEVSRYDLDGVQREVERVESRLEGVAQDILYELLRRIEALESEIGKLREEVKR